jgi:hypothetical protein
MFTVPEPGTVGPETYCNILVNASNISYDTSKLYNCLLHQNLHFHRYFLYT